MAGPAQLGLDNVNPISFQYYNVSEGPRSLPETSIEGGHDVDGAMIFVGRAQYLNEILPAKVLPSKNAAYVAHGGQEILVHNVEMVCTTGSVTWRPSRNGEIPAGAIHGGTAANGEWLFIGRVRWQGSLTVGKIHPTHNCIYVPFGGQELKLFEYETLCQV